MPISTEYRPGTFLQGTSRIQLDDWAAGSLGQFFGDATLDSVQDNQGTSWYLTRLDGWLEAPAVRTSLTDRPGDHGAFDGPAYLQPRVIIVEGVAIAADEASALRARDIVSSVCGDPSLGLRDLFVAETNRPLRKIPVRRSGETKTQAINATTFAWSMILVAPDPRRYSDNEHFNICNLAQPGTGGLVFPLVFPLTFGTGSQGGGMTLTNAGTIATWPRFQLQLVTGPTITDAATGQRLAFDPTFTVEGGQTLVVDTNAKTVLLNGVNRRDRLFIAEWFPLPPGDTSVRYDGSGAFANLVAFWRDAWT